MRRNFLTRVFTVFLAVCSTAVAHAQFAPVPMGTTDSLGVPDYLVTPGDVSPPTDFLEWVETTLPEGEAVVFDSLPPVLGQELHFTESSDVWMTYT